MTKTETALTGAENILWDLSGLYDSIDSPQIKKDLDLFVKTAIEFNHNFKGQLSQRLGDALKVYSDLTRLHFTLTRMPHLMLACDQGNEEVSQLLSLISETISSTSGKYLTFFELEIGQINPVDYQKLISEDEKVAHHKPMLDSIIKLSRYNLSEDEEKMVSLLNPFGSSEWDDFTSEMITESQYLIGQNKVSLDVALNQVDESKDADYRAKILTVINQGLRSNLITKYRARALNAVIGEKNTLDKLRGYDSAMSYRNLTNKVDDKTVLALHAAVQTKGVEACKRFYKLLSVHINEGEMRLLNWSDRNAPLPFKDTSIIKWNDAVSLVEQSYRSFSPTLADLVMKIINSNWVDAPFYEGKRSGAFNASGCYLNGNFSYNFLNFLGSNSDVSTLAHELGHGVHGLLALEEQGPLMWHAPMAYAETASIFGEMITFEFQLKKCKDDEQKLSLLMEKINRFINTVIRQISFSDFELIIHEKRKEGKLKVNDFSDAWMTVCEKYYGKEGEVFTYDREMMDSLWSYIPHFMNPFYVYAYAFGELFTQGLYAVKDAIGETFEDKYLDLLKAGGTRNAIELMQPFGLDPTEPDYWEKGITSSVFRWLDEAEKISKRLIT